MPKPYRLHSTYPLPPNADIVDRDGKPHVRMKDDRGRTVYYRLTKDGTKCLKPSKYWYFDVRDENGIVQRVKGFTDLKATEQRAAETVRKIERRQLGHYEAAEEHARRPLTDHLTEYAAYLEAKGNTTEHIRLTTGRVTALLSGCGFVFPRDVDAGKASEWLNTLRRDAQPIKIPEGVEAFRPSEAIALLGISHTALSKAIQRHNLPASGNGKARRIPRSTVEALVMNKAKGASPETINHYVRAVRGFFRWLVKAKRITANPLESLSLVNASVDVRRQRRELTADELQRLFVAARSSERTFRGLSGVDRYFLYLMAAATGFRANALANLTPADFDLNSPSPCVTLSARYAKNRKTKVQPLPVDVANALRDYLTNKPADGLIWAGTWARDHRGAEMIRVDLTATGIAYAIEGPDGPEYADFHSLRHSYLTLGGRSGIDLRTLQELAGHSKPELTARYSHRRLYDLQGAVDKLPNLVPTTTEPADAVPLRLTGTDGPIGPTSENTLEGVQIGQEHPMLRSKSVVPCVVTGGMEGHQTASDGILKIVGTGSGDVQKPLEKPRADTFRHRLASHGTNEDDGTRTRNHRIDSPPVNSL